MVIYVFSNIAGLAIALLVISFLEIIANAVWNQFLIDTCSTEIEYSIGAIIEKAIVNNFSEFHNNLLDSRYSII